MGMAKQRNPSTPPPEQRLRRWHRLFGLLLSDHFLNSPFSVVREMDLSHRQQMLDVVVVRRRPGALTSPLPDGLDDLADHNLITFKSYWEALTDWTLKELTGHYGNYRKQVSPRGQLLPEDQFRLIAVCARRPRDLFDAVASELVRPGVYRCRRGTDTIRVVVVAELPREERNALLHLFSAAQEQVQYGIEHYRTHSADISTIVNDLFKEHTVEGLAMPYTLEDYKRERAQGLWPSPEARKAVAKLLKQFTTEELLEGRPPEEILKQFTAEEIEAYLNRVNKQPPTTRKKNPKRRS
jgi:hypothetical protein